MVLKNYLSKTKKRAWTGKRGSGMRSRRSKLANPSTILGSLSRDHPRQEGNERKPATDNIRFGKRI